MDEAQVQRDIARLDYEAQTADASERVKHQVQLADRGLQGLLLINGGALVALFTLIGSSAHLRLTPYLMWWSFGSFSAGILLSLLANFGAFFSQGFYHGTAQFQAWDAQRAMYDLEAKYSASMQKSHRRGQLAELGGVASASLALIAFVIGCGLALAGVLPQG